MLNSWNCLAVLLCCWLAGSSQAQQHVGELDIRNGITSPGEPMYYLMADTGPIVGSTDELRRTNRSLWKWWGDLFNQNNCCNNNNNYNNNLPNYNNNYLPTPLIPLGGNSNCNGKGKDPLKELKLFKKLPDLWGNQCGQCGQCGYQQPVKNYEPPKPVDYTPPPAPYTSGYETPNPAYDGPGDGDAGYVAPAAPPAEYEKPAPAPSAPSYEPPTTPPSYEPIAPAPESYSKVDDYGKSDKSYGGAQPPQIVYQPIIYLTATEAKIEKDKYQQQEQIYQPEAPAPAPVYEAPAPAPAPVYAPPPAPTPAAPCQSPTYAGYLPLVGLPVCGYPAAPPAAAYAAPPAPPPAAAYAAPSPAPTYNSPCHTCQMPIRLSVVDQPYRVAPELFQEYNYRLGLGEQKGSY